jgi:hypothetical protein
MCDLVDQSEPESTDEVQELDDAGPAPLLDGEEPVPAKLPDPDRHRHPESSRRSSCRSVRPCGLIETACAVLDDTDAVEDHETQNQAEDPIAFAASESDPNMMHCGKAVRAKDSAEFKAAMLKEVDAHTNQGCWEAWAKADVPTDQDILPSV